MNAAAVAASLATAAWYGEGTMIGICITALLIAVPSLLYCTPSTSIIPLSAGLTLIISTILTILFIPNDAFIAEASTDNTLVWVAAILQGAALIPQVMLFFFTAAAVFKMSLNWVMVAGLGWLVGLGLSISRYLVMLIIHNTEVDNGMVMNSTIVYGILINLIMFAVSFYLIGRKLRKERLVITSNGLEAVR